MCIIQDAPNHYLLHVKLLLALNLGFPFWILSCSFNWRKIQCCKINKIQHIKPEFKAHFQAFPSNVRILQVIKNYTVVASVQCKSCFSLALGTGAHTLIEKQAYTLHGS